MSSSNKRERDLARQKFGRQQQRRADRQQQRRRRTQVITVLAALSVVGVAALALVLSSRSSSDPTASTPTATPTPSASETAASPSPSGSTSPSASRSAKPCAAAATPTTKTSTWPAPPGTPLKPTSQYFIKLTTNCGDIDIAVDQKAPKTADSMIFLANQGFYADSDCFRLTTQGLYVLQCGSPTNNGQGGPGYTVPDENLPANGANNFPVGTVAMANAGAGTAGSQFFIVYKATTLPANYTIWGKVVAGLDVVGNVAAAGVQGGGTDGKPVQPIVITKATTRETMPVG